MGLMRLLPRPNERSETDPVVSETAEPEELANEDAGTPVSLGEPASTSAETSLTASASRVRVLALANQKGGVAKTTTTLNLGVAFMEMGKRVLLVDLDPQGNLTMSQGLNPDAIERSMFDVLVHKIPIADVIEPQRGRPRRLLHRSGRGRAGACVMIGRERSLEKALVAVRDKYDFILIDTPPSLGLLTINAFVAATGVIVPVQCEYLSLRGLVQLENTLAMVRENLNPQVGVEGIVADHVRRAHAALAGGDRDPRGELRDLSTGRGSARRFATPRLP